MSTDDRRRRRAIPPREVERIAVAAQVDPRTVRRVLDGLSVKPVNGRRVRDALERLAAGELQIGAAAQ